MNKCVKLKEQGYGRSASTDNNYEWHHVADQTLALMDALGIEKFNVVGHDWGTIITSMMSSCTVSDKSKIKTLEEK